MSAHPIIAEDIRGVLSRTQGLWPDLKGASIFLTGATGFFGIWLLETLLAANREFSLGLRILALSRDAAGFINFGVGRIVSGPRPLWRRAGRES